MCVVVVHVCGVCGRAGLTTHGTSAQFMVVVYVCVRLCVCVCVCV